MINLKTIKMQIDHNKVNSNNINNEFKFIQLKSPVVGSSRLVKTGWMKQPSPSCVGSL